MATCSLSSFGGLRRLDVETGSFELLLAQPGGAFLGPDGRHVLLLQSENAKIPVGTASVYDLRERRGWPLATHGNQVTLMAWDPSGKRVVTGSREGIVRVGPVTGEEPHLLIGHQAPSGVSGSIQPGASSPRRARTARCGSGRCPRDNRCTPGRVTRSSTSCAR